jgi:hypothetical protein
VTRSAFALATSSRKGLDSESWFVSCAAENPGSMPALPNRLAHFMNMASPGRRLRPLPT